MQKSRIGFPMLPTVMMVSGFLVALLRLPARAGHGAAIAHAFPLLYRFLLNKWYFDELYDCIFVRPAFWLGRLFWKGGDGRIIDGLGPDGVAARVVDVARSAVKLQTGYVYHYAFAMLIGVAAFITWYLAGGCADVRLRDSLRPRPSCRSSARPSSSRCGATTRRRCATRAGRRCRRRIVDFLLSLVVWARFDHGAARPSSSSSRRAGSAPASSTSWASTASPCPSCC